MRFGYRPLRPMLARKQYRRIIKRIYRLYCEAELAMRTRRRSRVRWSGIGAEPATKPRNERWSMDFVSDCIRSGRGIPMLTLVDDHTPECRVIKVDPHWVGYGCVGCWIESLRAAALPEAIVLDNGPEFRRRVLAPGSEEHGSGRTSFNPPSRFRTRMWKASTAYCR